MELTKTDIAALRKADYYRFQADQNGGRIVAVKRAPEPSPSNPFPVEVTYPISCHVTLCDYSDGNHGGSFHVEEWEGWEHVDNRSYEFTHSLFAFVKTGDTLKLEWLKGNNSPAMEERGVNRDELRVEVARPNGDVFPFMIKSRIIVGSAGFCMIKIRKLKPKEV